MGPRGGEGGRGSYGPGEAGVEKLLGELLAPLDGGRLHDVLLVLLHERPVVRAAVLRHEPRRLARLGLHLRQLRRQRHRSASAATPTTKEMGNRDNAVISREETYLDSGSSGSVGDGDLPLGIGGGGDRRRRRREFGLCLCVGCVIFFG